MANKLAGQRAKFSRWRAAYYTTSDEAQRQRAERLMAEVLADAPANGFTEDDVTQGEDTPQQVRQLVAAMKPAERPSDEDPGRLVEQLGDAVAVGPAHEIGEGEQFVYAYGYRCAPDRLKIGSTTGDVVARIAAQISTGTPDKPVLWLVIRTDDCRALERVLHGAFRLKGKQIDGAGAEWFVASVEEVVATYRKIIE